MEKKEIPIETKVVSIDAKYIEAIQNNQISLLVFDKKVIKTNELHDRKLQLIHGTYSTIVNVVYTEVKSFDEITEEEAQMSGFVNKSFLKDELMRRFNIDSLDEILNSIDTYLFYLVKIDTPKKEPNYYHIVKDNSFDWWGKNKTFWTETDNKGYKRINWSDMT